MLENTAYIALSRQVAMRRQLDILANNLANMDTTAFKAESLMFEEYLVKAGADTELSFVQDVAVARALTEGELAPTDNPLDIAISGRGYLVVGTEDGERYTRNGHLRLDEGGTLVTQEGNPILDDASNPIIINSASAPVIAKDGTISGDAGLIGRLQIVTFDNEQVLRPIGSGLYTTEEIPRAAENASVVQGMIERSNVQPIIEITKMIDLLRSYQSTQRMMQQDSELRQRSIRQLGRLA